MKRTYAFAGMIVITLGMIGYLKTELAEVRDESQRTAARVMLLTGTIASMSSVQKNMLELPRSEREWARMAAVTTPSEPQLVSAATSESANSPTATDAAEVLTSATPRRRP